MQELVQHDLIESSGDTHADGNCCDDLAPAHPRLLSGSGGVKRHGFERLRLRDGLRWSDGEPLTADDFAFAYRSVS